MSEFDDGYDELMDGVDELYASEMADELGREVIDADRLRDIEWNWAMELRTLARERDEQRRGRSER